MRIFDFWMNRGTLGNMSGIFAFDRSVVESWNGFLAHHAAVADLARVIGVYGIYLIPLIWLWWWFASGQKQREYLLSGLLSGVVAWGVIGSIWKAFIYRARPDQALPVKELLFKRPDNSFPSDHAALLSGIAFFFWLKGQRVASFWLFILAIAVSLARIALAVHYPTDILVGFLDGFIGAYIVSLFHDWLSDTVWAWLIGLARKLHLA
jgi:undecaprenyl-diphosphatase